MKKLTVDSQLEYARCAVAVIRALKIMDTKFSYEDLGRAVGLISEHEKWAAWHRQQIEALLNVASAVEGKSATPLRLEFERIINRRTGEPGRGISKQSRIIREKVRKTK